MLWERFWKSQLDIPKTDIQAFTNVSEFYSNIKKFLKIICVMHTFVSQKKHFSYFGEQKRI